jgi:hypothetical protein
MLKLSAGETNERRMEMVGFRCLGWDGLGELSIYKSVLRGNVVQKKDIASLEIA